MMAASAPALGAGRPGAVRAAVDAVLTWTRVVLTAAVFGVGMVLLVIAALVTGAVKVAAVHPRPPSPPRRRSGEIT